MSSWTVALAASMGSLMAAGLGYALGRLIGDTRFVNWLVGARRAKAEQFVERYGFWGIATAALTPIPFAICAWSAGALRMPPAAFAAASLFRIPKTCFFVWLMLQSYLAAS
ncbi:VTT domain-containing protein [Planctomycetota bacterium]|nr:VTT domain-containing protein [Planctomycetota bacterium]